MTSAVCCACPQCQPWFVVWLRPRAAAVHTLDAVFSSDDAHRLELLLSLLGRCARQGACLSWLSSMLLRACVTPCAAFLKCVSGF